MRVIEAEAKAMLARRGIATPLPGHIYREGDAAAQQDHPVAVKAQNLSGKRAEAGLIQLVAGESAPAAVDQIRDAMRRSGQEPVILVEARSDIAAEYYLAWRVDDLTQRYVMMVSAAGGSDIEDRGETIEQYYHSPLSELQPQHLLAALRGAGIPDAHIGPVARFAVSLFLAFREEDAALLEINPLVITGKGRAVAVDAKLVLDDNGAKRHLDHSRLISATLQSSELTELERIAGSAGFTFVELKGPVAVFSSGAGLGMCALDMLADAGMPAANFSDAPGGASPETFARMGQVVFELAKREDVKAILFFFVLAATSLKSIADSITYLLDNAQPPKPLVVGLIAAGAAEREMTLDEATRLIRARGYPCVTELAEAVDTVRTLADAKEGH